MAQQRREIGLRIALGASPRDILRGVLEITRVGATGIAIGLPLSLSLTRMLASMLYGVHPNEPTVIVASTILLPTATLTAGYLPARRAV